VLSLYFLLLPIYRWRTGSDLPVAKALDLGVAGVIAGIVRGKSALPTEPPSSPEADAIAASFHKMFRRERRERRGW
jgi:hypothetical protein